SRYKETDYTLDEMRTLETIQFKLNDTSPKQWEPTGDVWRYNYTLNQESSIILDYQAAPPPPTLETQIELLSEISQAVWNSGVLHITINVSYTENGIDWYQVPNEGTFNCYVEDWLTGHIVLTFEMTPNYQGMNLQNYSMTINADQLSAGDSYKKYWFIIEGEIPGYEPPEPYYQQVQVNATPATMNLYDYDTHLIVTNFDKE
ncbi:MAG: hypothetical protein ACFFE5_02770, partial [Candidatus Thorarchaeota archaeon]